MIRNFFKNIPILRVIVIKSRRFIFFVRVYLYNIIANLYHSFEIKRVRKKILNGNKINVVFLVSDKSVWKTDLVFQEMEKNSRYNPCIIVIPRVNAENTLDNAEDTYKYFKEKGYKSKIAYSHGDWQQLESISNIDIIFFPFETFEISIFEIFFSNRG